MNTDLLYVGSGLAAAVILRSALGRTGHYRGQRDPQRAFTASQRELIFERCGRQCEHIGLLGRCNAAAVEADHVFPWAKGGATSLSNAQGLCRAHNRQKSAKVPSRSAIRRLERRRAAYFPPGARTDVFWQIGQRSTG